MRQQIPIGLAIKHYRLKAGLTQCDLAELLRHDGSWLPRPNWISRIEGGYRIPTIATLDRIGKVLNVESWKILKAAIYLRDQSTLPAPGRNGSIGLSEVREPAFSIQR